MSTAYNTPTSISCVCDKCRVTQFYWLNSSQIAFFRSQSWFKIALVGLGIHFQNGQRDNFTHQPPCFYANSFGVLITVKSSLTSDFFEKYATTQHSSFMMPAWGNSAVENDSKNTYILSTYFTFRQTELLVLDTLAKKKKKKKSNFPHTEEFLCLHYI